MLGSKGNKHTLFIHVNLLSFSIYRTLPVLPTRTALLRAVCELLSVYQLLLNGVPV